MKKKILIVDDSEFMRLIIKKILKDKDVEIIEATNGKMAIEKYIEHQPNVVTMDITMPDMDGVTALKEILKIDKEANVILCSSIVHSKNVKEVYEAGAKHFVGKPFKNEVLMKIVEKYI